MSLEVLASRIMTPYFGMSLYIRAGALSITLMFLVAEQISRDVLKTIARTGGFEDKAGAGIVFQVAIEDAIGLSSQFDKISSEIEDQV